MYLFGNCIWAPLELIGTDLLADDRLKKTATADAYCFRALPALDRVKDPAGNHWGIRNISIV